MIVRFAAHALLSKYNIPINPNLHVQCLCHVVNLVVQAILSALSEAENPDNIDYYTVDGKHAPVHSDPTQDLEQLELENKVFTEETKKVAARSENIEVDNEEKAVACSSALSKVCTVSFCFPAQ